MPILIAALLPPLQAIESISAAALILRGRYDLRGLWLTSLDGAAARRARVGALHGVTAAVIGVVAAQALTTVSILAVGLAGLRRFPAAAPRPLGGRRAADPPLRPLERGLHRADLAAHLDRAARRSASSATRPTSGSSAARRRRRRRSRALSAPVRMILLTEQTRDWEHGRPEVVLAGLRRYVAGSALLMALVARSRGCS